MHEAAGRCTKLAELVQVALRAGRNYLTVCKLIRPTQKGADPGTRALCLQCVHPAGCTRAMPDVDGKKVHGKFMKLSFAERGCIGWLMVEDLTKWLELLP